MSHKIARNSAEAFKAQEKHVGKPHGWLQWKGTKACLDFHCKCGAHLHFDASFLYNVKCLNCNTSYTLSGYIEAIELVEEPINCLHAAIDEELKV